MGLAPERTAGFLKSYQLFAVFIALVVVALSIAGFTWIKGSEVTVIVDGEPRRLMTQAETIGELLEKEGMDVAPADMVTPSTSSLVSDGMTVVVRTAVPVTIHRDGESLQVDVIGQTVAEALIAAGINPDKSVKVEPALSEVLTAGMGISVREVFIRVVEETVTVPFDRVVRNDQGRLAGQTEVITEGVPGQALRTSQLVMADGELVETRAIAQRIVTAPVDEVIENGTRPHLRPAAFVRPASHNSPTPQGERLEVTATGYAPGVAGVGTRTATGARAQRGIIAVDPRVISLGTRLYVPGYGYGIAADTGGAIRGNKIDLCFDTGAEAINWGRRTVTIVILR